MPLGIATGLSLSKQMGGVAAAGLVLSERMKNRAERRGTSPDNQRRPGGPLNPLFDYRGLMVDFGHPVAGAERHGMGE